MEQDRLSLTTNLAHDNPFIRHSRAIGIARFRPAITSSERKINALILLSFTDDAETSHACSSRRSLESTALLESFESSCASASWTLQEIFHGGPEDLSYVNPIMSHQPHQTVQPYST